jgi:RND superfamily putative drug exporter
VFARIGRFCFRHPRLVVLAWVLIFAGGIASLGSVTSELNTSNQASQSMESVQAATLITDASQYGGKMSAVVSGASADDATLRSAVNETRVDLLHIDGVAVVVDPYLPKLPVAATTLLTAKDRQAVMIIVQFDKGLGVEGEEKVEDEVSDRIRRISDEVSGTTVTIGGTSLLQREMNEQTRRDTEVGELIALPITLIAMVVIFGGAVAAGIPIIGALAALGSGILILLGLLRLMQLDPTVLSVTTVLALGLAIDYSLLLVNRFREERFVTRTVEEAIEATVDSAGRTIMFSAITVALSLAGLFVFPSPIFRGIGAAGCGVVLFSLMAGLTLTPALLSIFARRVGLGRHRSERPRDDGFFARMARLTRKAPLVATLALASILLAAGVPFLSVTFVNSNAGLLPRGFESRDFVEVVKERFPGQAAPAVTVVANASYQELQLWALQVQKEAPGVAGIGFATKVASGLSSIDFAPVASEHDVAGQKLVEYLRANRPPFQIWVTGDAAILVDFLAEVVTYAPWAIALMVVSTFILLFAMTGSLLVPLKALIMNVLSLGASFGALKLIFQDGHLSSFLGFESTGGLEPWIPVLVFCFAFGLSMDYEVFLLSRIKELRDQGLDSNHAVEIGLQRSGKIITSAGLLMIIVFVGFAAGRMISIKELGVAGALAVAVDATFVRCLLVPATMALLGEANWWAPAPLKRFYDKYGLHEDAAARAAQRAAKKAREGGGVERRALTRGTPPELPARIDDPDWSGTHFLHELAEKKLELPAGREPVSAVPGGSAGPASAPAGGSVEPAAPRNNKTVARRDTIPAAPQSGPPGPWGPLLPPISTPRPPGQRTASSPPRTWRGAQTGSDRTPAHRDQS